MPKIMLINVTHSEESRVGIVSEGVLESFEIESLSREHLKGNIYKGVVHRIHPALEAAFVDIGAERDAFLPLDEICFRNLTHPPAGNSQRNDGENGRRRLRIRDVLRPGEEILVQIAKEQFANKPPTLTTFYSLPGRYLVLLPGSDDTGISRRIEGEERIRLRKLVEELHPPEGFGLIVRTAAGVDEDTGELARDLTYLQRLWDSVEQAAQRKRAPALVYREHDIVLRTIRDFFTPDIDEIYIDNEEVFQRARDFLRNVMPGKESVLHLYQGEQPIFSAFDVESQIESIFKRRVQLRSGGSIVIDGTEALTAIDVNSGGAVRGSNPEETAFRTNQQAAIEIARQLRLRDIGGLIVIDFIDMRDSRHIHEIERITREAMRPDKARHEVGRISRFGLMEISRQRLRPTAMATTYTACPMCEGHGAVRSTESAALVALRKIHNRVASGDVASLLVSLPSLVAVYLLNQKRDELARLEQRYDTRIQVTLSEQLMPHQVEIEARQRMVHEKVGTAVQPGSVAAVDAAAHAESTNRKEPEQTPAEETSSNKKRRRRRGRRRGGAGLRAAAAIGEALASLGSFAAASSAEQGRPAAEDVTAVIQTGASKRPPSKRRRGTRRPRGAGKRQAADAGAAGRGGRQATKAEQPGSRPGGSDQVSAATAEVASVAQGSDAGPKPRMRSRRRTSTSRTKRTPKAAAATTRVDAEGGDATAPTEATKAKSRGRPRRPRKRGSGTRKRDTAAESSPATDSSQGESSPPGEDR